MSWLQQLIDCLFSFVPRIWLVNPDEAGVRITLGSRVYPTSPGWYFYWPLIQECIKLTVTVQVKDLRAQSLTTKDGKNIIISGAVQYKITDAGKALLNVQNFDETLQILTTGSISDFISDKDYADCEDITAFEDVLLRKIRETASGFGLKIMRVFITDFCQSKTYRIVGIMNNENLQHEESR